jgi:hypothetical protein
MIPHPVPLLPPRPRVWPRAPWGPPPPRGSRSRALPPPFDRNHPQPLPPAPAAPERVERQCLLRETAFQSRHQIGNRRRLVLCQEPASTLKTFGDRRGLSHGYPSDLSDAEWARLEPLIPGATPGGRPRKTDMRAAMNANFDLPAHRLPLALSAPRQRSPDATCVLVRIAGSR